MNFKCFKGLYGGKIIKKKSLGQNFLKDERVLGKIVEAGELSPDDNILEIGPGEGALTKKLLEKVNRVLAIEKDERMKDNSSQLQQLDEGSDGLKLHFGDILDVNLAEILQKNNFDEYKVIANIPYYITGKIIRLLFEQEKHPELIVILVQKEVADRICAKNGKQSILSLSVQYYASAEVVDYVPRESFDPAPKVDSAILKIVPKQPQTDADLTRTDIENSDKKFFRLVRVGFSSPRKTLINNLKNGLKLEREELEGIFKKLNLDQNIRAEKMTIDNWQQLGEKIK